MKELSSQELRIGNLLSVGNYDVKVAEIHHLGVQVYDLEETQDTLELFSDRIKPIPLTEEWLLKLGFEKHHEYGYFYIDCFVFDLDMNGKFYMCDIDIHIVLKYVHQLQNLYFACTGKELTL